MGILERFIRPIIGGRVEPEDETRIASASEFMREKDKEEHLAFVRGVLHVMQSVAVAYILIPKDYDEADFEKKKVKFSVRKTVDGDEIYVPRSSLEQVMVKKEAIVRGEIYYLVSDNYQLRLVHKKYSTKTGAHELGPFAKPKVKYF